MFHYDYEKRPRSSNSCDSRSTVTTDWSRVYPSSSRAPSRSGERSADRSSERVTDRSSERVADRTSVRSERSVNAKRPLPPRPILCERMPQMPTKTSVPLKVWIIASASCFAVCAALVLATVVITKWGATQTYASSDTLYAQPPEPIYAHSKIKSTKIQPSKTSIVEHLADVDVIEDTNNDLESPILEQLSIFKNVVPKRDNLDKVIETEKVEKTLINKPQIHPLHDTTLYHPEKKIEKKNQAIYPSLINDQTDTRNIKKNLPEFKPIQPEVLTNNQNDMKLPDGYSMGVRKHDADFYEEYYNDENFYDDYMQSNSMTNYLIEKVQELHDWITTDPDFEMEDDAKRKSGNNFGQLLRALNDSIIEGNVSIVMNKLKSIYFGENNSTTNHNRKIILTNSTDLLSFGILTLDVMLLHNIQLMAWENQESARYKMLKDPDVFAFNALFLEPTKVETIRNEVNHHSDKSGRRQNRLESMDNFDFGKSLLENVMEIGMSTARAAIHLGRVYKNTKLLLNQITNKDTVNSNIQTQISRNIDGNTHALNHLQNSFSKNESFGGNSTSGFYTELDCVWTLYCRNLMSTAKLNPPYGIMARINGVALRMLAGDLSADNAFETMIHEALNGWTELKCNDLFPRCSKVDAASVIMENILPSSRRTQGKS